MFTKKFWKGAAERCVKSAAQFGLFAWGTTTFTDVGDVVNTGEAVGLAIVFGAGISILTSLASAGIGETDSPSAVKES